MKLKQRRRSILEILEGSIYLDKWLSKMGPVWSGLKDKLIIIYYILLYLLIELLRLASVLILSITICHWFTKVVFLVAQYRVQNIGQTYIIIYIVGISAAQVPKPWRFSLTPAKLRHFQREKYPALFGLIRNILIISSIILFASLQFYTYQYKYGSTEPPKSSSQLYYNDLTQLFSLSVVTFVLSQVIQSYREFNRLQCQRELAPERMKSPHWFIYLFFYFSLVLMELLYSVPLFLFMSGVVKLCDYIASLDSLTFTLPIILGYGVGCGLGFLEELYFPLDRYYQRYEPYFTTIHWDSRLNILVFTLVPLLCRWYYIQDDINQEEDLRLNFVLFSGCISTTFLVLAKYQTLFSFVFSRQFQEVRNLNPIPTSPLIPLPHQNRVHPSPHAEEGQCGPPNSTATSGRDNLPETERAVPPEEPQNSLPKSSILFYFPLSFNPNLKEKPCSTEGGRDQASLSTGTCSSLVSRINNNNNPSGQQIASVANTISQESSRKTCPRSPPLPPTLHKSTSENVIVDGNNNRSSTCILIQAEVPVPGLTPEESQSAPRNLSKSVVVDKPSVNDNHEEGLKKVEHDHEPEPMEAIVKLRRSPSSTLPVLLGNEMMMIQKQLLSKKK